MARSRSQDQLNHQEKSGEVIISRLFVSKFKEIGPKTSGKVEENLDCPQFLSPKLRTVISILKQSQDCEDFLILTQSRPVPILIRIVSPSRILPMIAGYKYDFLLLKVKMFARPRFDQGFVDRLMKSQFSKPVCHFSQTQIRSCKTYNYSNKKSCNDGDTFS